MEPTHARHDRSRLLARRVLEQQTATAEILRTISRLPVDVQPVFETVVANAARVCEAPDVALALVEGDAHGLSGSFLSELVTRRACEWPVFAVC